MILEDDESDPIRPVAIDHQVEELWADGQRKVLEQRYNYLVYHFEHDGKYCRARTYIEDIGSVTLFGPYARRDLTGPIHDAEFTDKVTAYLQRRFRHVKHHRAG
jgi:hypothetical protein